MFSLFYNIFLFFYFLCLLPKIFYERIFLKKTRQKTFERLFGSFSIPIFDQEKKIVIWVHAVSFGETRSIAPLVEKIKHEIKNAWILFSTVTETGQEEAKKSIPADAFCYLPYDFSFAMKKVLKRVSPDVVILSETDLWFHFLKFSKKFGEKILLVSGKISQKSFQRYQFFSFFAKRVFSFIDLFCVQNETYENLFLQLPGVLSPVIVGGNLKYRTPKEKFSEEEKKIWKNKFKISESDFVVTIGSTHAPEENLLLEVFKNLWKNFPNLKILLAPRHPERFLEVKKILKSLDIPFGCFTDLSFCSGQEKVILIDTMGFLKHCFELSDLAIIGGSFIPQIGGHNVLEPPLLGTPVFFGPVMFSQEDLKKTVLETNCGKEVSLGSLGEEVLKFFQNDKERKILKENCQNILAKEKNPLEETWKNLLPFLSKKT